MSDDSRRAHWVTISEAAKLVDKNERTVRRWIAGGRLEVDRSQSPHKVDIAPLVPDVPGAPGTPDPDRLQAEIDRLQGDIENLQKRFDDLRNERDYIRQLLQVSMINQQKLIDAPKERRFRWPWQKDSD